VSVWPESLPCFERGSISVEPIPRRVAFTGSTGVPLTRIVSRTRKVKWRGAMKVTLAQLEELLEFAETAAEPFTFTRPDTGVVCDAFWLPDGEPTENGEVGAARRVTVGLLLNPA
jgi:hypothetical protein